MDKLRSIDGGLPISYKAFLRAIKDRENADAEAKEALDRVQYLLLSESGKGFFFLDMDDEIEHLSR